MKKIFLILCTVLLFLSGLAFAGENYLVGTSSGESITSRGTDNTIVGNYAGRYIKNGRGNTFLGMFAGDVGSGTSGTTKLGYMAGNTDSTSHKLFINTGFYPSYGIFGTFSSGYFGVNKVTPTVAWDVTGAGNYSGALTVTGAITSTTASVFSPSLTVRANTAGAGSDSSAAITFTSGTPVLNFYGSDGDTYLQTITTGDAASWTGATGGYLFDAAIDGTDIINTTIGAGGASTGAFTTISASSTSALNAAVTATPSVTVRNNVGGAGADSLLSVGFTAGNPVLTFNASDGDEYTQSITTGDAASFSGATGGYIFDDTYINTVTGGDAVVDVDYKNNVSRADGFKYFDFVVDDSTDAATSSAENTAGFFRLNKRAGSNGTYSLHGIEGVAASYYADEAGTFRGIYGRTYTAPGATASMRTAVGGEFSARASYSGGDSCVAESGTAFVGSRIWMAPYFTAASMSNINNFWGLWIYGEHANYRNGDAAIKIGTAGGGFTTDINLQNGETISNAADGDIAFGGATLTNHTAKVRTYTGDGVLTAAMSGDTITNTGSAAGDSLFLPTCASGLQFDFVSTDADSMIMQCASGDSIFSGASLKPSFEGHAVNQSFSIVGMPTAGGQFNWIVRFSTGTWAGN